MSIRLRNCLPMFNATCLLYGGLSHVIFFFCCFFGLLCWFFFCYFLLLFWFFFCCFLVCCFSSFSVVFWFVVFGSHSDIQAQSHRF